VPAPLMVALRVSVPPPPANTSPVFTVCWPLVFRLPSKLSFPAVPAKLFALVVSHL
jgi:hypothetical protein